MSRKFQTIATALLAAALFTAVLLFFILSNRITMNPPGTIGNTAGNLHNGGLFCELDGTVYFSNSYDGGSLYAMDSSEENIRKLSSVNAQNILAGGDYLYYFQMGASGNAGMGYVLSVRSFNRTTLDGSRTTGLNRDIIAKAQLVDNYLYILAAGEENPQFYKLKIDESEQTVLADYEIDPSCAAAGMIYYSDPQSGHSLYQLNTSSDTASLLWEGSVGYPVIQGDFIYYMDVESNYCLCRYSLSQGTAQTLTTDRVDCFNVGGGYVYYQKNGDTPQLICMREDGTGAFVLAEGNYTKLHMTSQYVYFQEFGNDTALYHSPLGSAGYEVFSGARDAAIAETQ